MKKFLRVLSLFFVLVVMLSQISCAPSGSSIDIYAFDTAIHIETHDKKISDQTIEKINNQIKRLDGELDAHNSSSFVYEINSANEQAQVVVSSDVVKLLNLSNQYCEFSGGKFSHVLYPVVEAWQFYNYPKLNFSPPANDTIEQLKNSGILSPNNVVIDTENNTITKTNKETKIDLGGIAKGYAADTISNILKEDGHISGYVNVGGSSLYLLDVDHLTIKHPRATEKMPTVIEIFGQNTKNTAVSTSGDYQRYYNYEGKKYSHIIDGTTCMPSQTNVISATLLSDSATFSDALTTALCCYEYSPSNHGNSPLVLFMKKIVDSAPNSLLFVIYDDGQNKLLLTNANSDDFSLLDTQYQIVNI